MGTWISKNAFLSYSEMKVNATNIYRYFRDRGWTPQAICAMLGNMETESTINPGIWEGLNPYAGGYGLVQWTPYTKYSEWYGSGWENNGVAECSRIQYEMINGLQWFENYSAPIITPPLTFKEFSTSLESVETLANYFLWYYEHPAVTIQPNRATQGRAWLDYFTENPPYVKKRKMPLWMYLRRT